MTTTKFSSQEDIDNACIGIREHFERILAEKDKNLDLVLAERKIYTETRLTAIEKSIEVASNESIIRLDASKAADERRFDLLNEFRKTVEDWTKTAATKEEVGSLRKELEFEVAKIDTKLEAIKSDVSDLKTTRANEAGKTSQTTAIVAIIFSLLAALGMIINIYLELSLH